MPDWDDVFKMATPKYVYLRDAKLGILKFVFMALIFFYVVVYDIMYSCSHLLPRVATGYGSITMHHPMAKEGCKAQGNCKLGFKNIAELSYCKEHQELAKLEKNKRLLSHEKDDEEDGKGEDDGLEIGDYITKVEECRYLDNDRLTLAQTPKEIFIPTRYVSSSQEMSDDCFDPEMKHTEPHSIKDYRCAQAWITKSEESFYVADIGDFLLSFQHSYMAPSLGMSGVSTEHRGLFAACPTNHPASISSECKRMVIPNTEGEVAAEDKAELFDPKEEFGIDTMTGTESGLDRISVLDLLKLTPIAQKKTFQTGDASVADRKLPSSFGHPKNSIREMGGMLMLAVNYDNTGYMRPGFPGLDMPAFSLGAIKPITYTYRPYFIPTSGNKKVEVLFTSDKAKTRTVNVWYGVTIKMSFEGQLCKFGLSALLTTLTTALVLVTSASTIVTYMALYLFEASEKYTLLMYQYSEDFSDYKSLVEQKKNERVDYAAGDLLQRNSASQSLSAAEVYTLLVDHEFRMNRIDGRDPKLAFTAAVDPKAVHDDVMKMVSVHEEFMNDFYKRHGVTKQGGMKGAE